MNPLIKKISIPLLILITTFLFITCGNKKNCFLCEGYGKLPCVVCEKSILEEEECKFCNGNGMSICTLCNGNGIEK